MYITLTTTNILFYKIDYFFKFIAYICAMCKIRYAPFAHRAGAALMLCLAASRTSTHHELDAMLREPIEISPKHCVKLRLVIGKAYATTEKDSVNMATN